MKKEILLELINKLPHGCEIGIIDLDDLYIDREVEIKSHEYFKTVIEGRKSNESRKCDYYIC
ncbi:MAG: hypothetical protein ACRCVJ_18720 [Clostridium sp.]|uniref:hypothetical protein n=1 Tax=Clostridium sp. TaxID=1506 RepID=UPI003F3BCFE9